MQSIESNSTKMARKLFVRQMIHCRLPLIRRFGVSVCGGIHSISRLAAQMRVDVAVVGGGCIGINIATALRQRLPFARVAVIEKEWECGSHASGRNSGVLHAGFYYSSESMKARFTREGNRRLTEFIADRGLYLNRCGKLVVARDVTDLETLHLLYERGKANGIDVAMIDESETRAIDPFAKTFQRALWSPTTSVADPTEVATAQVQEAMRAGVVIQTGCTVLGVKNYTRHVVLSTDRGESIEAGHIVNAAGLYADRLARMCGVGTDLSIIPFKGLFLHCPQFDCTPRTNIYPVPDLRRPFLGQHWTVVRGGGSKIGPTSLPAWTRENYRLLPPLDKPFETIEIISQLSRLFWKNADGIRALARQQIPQYSKTNMILGALSLLHPDCGIDLETLAQRATWMRAGIRAQLIRNDRFVQDFIVETAANSTHVLNVVSPGWTCAMPFADHVVDDYIIPGLNSSS